MLPVEKARVPTRGILSFGYQRSPTHRHQGVDFPAKKGAPVRSVSAGEVVKVVHSHTVGFRGYGKTVVVKNDNPKTFILYGHLNSIQVVEGDRLRPGDQLGTVGYTAYYTEKNEDTKSRAPHLHFEVSHGPYPKDSEAPRVDPVAFLRALPGSDPAPGAAGRAAIVVLVLLAAALFLAATS